MLMLRFHEESARLIAVVEPGKNRPPLDAATVRKQLAAQGLSGLYVDESALARVLIEYAESPGRTELAIGERRDGVCTVSIGPDNSFATLTIVRPFGGAAVTADQVYATLHKAGVIAGILNDELETVLTDGAATDRVVARWREATDGTDATFVSLLPEVAERRPQADQNGIIDYRELGEMAAVQAGTPLMRRIPAVPGEDGVDVMGRVLKARPVKNTPFWQLVKGAKVDPADPNVLCATICGRPIVGPTGISVDPVVVLPEVDISTGNVTFEGSVNVEGNVSSGMHIRATADVFVGGAVGAASITAGGKIVVKGGVVGGEANASSSERAIIRCQGSFQARFLQYAHVESSLDVLIEDHCMHSTVAAGRRLVVGGAGSKTGHIRGGTVSAGMLVKAVTFGSPQGVKTLVRAGFDARLRTRLIAVDKEVDALQKKESALRHTLTGGYDAKAQEALATVVEQLDRLREEAAQIRDYAKDSERARVVADRSIYGGTEVLIQSRRWTTNDDRGSGVVRLQEGHIGFGAC